MYKSTDLTNKSLIITDSTNNNTVTNIQATYNNNVEIHLFPNPNTGEFYISPLINEKTISNIEILNILGEPVSFSKITNNELITINLSDAPKGIYFVKIICNGYNYMKKIVCN